MAVAASVGLVWKSCRCAQPPCVANRGASWRVRLCVLGADARSDTDVYSARSAAMAGSACAQEEHRSERRPNGRTSARGGALSEWSRRRRAFAHAAAQRCKSVQSVMDTSQSVRTARVRGPATTVQVVGRGGGRTRLLLLCTGPSRSVVSSLIGIFPPIGSLNSSSKNAAMQPAIGLLPVGGSASARAQSPTQAGGGWPGPAEWAGHEHEAPACGQSGRY